MTRAAAVLEATNVSIAFPGRDGVPVAVVEDVTLAVVSGRTLGVVGESGSGKTTLARALVALHPIARGAVVFEGRALSNLDLAGWRGFRRTVQMVFQDPYASLDPRMTVAQAIAEPLAIHGLGDRRERRERVRDLLRRVALPEAVAERYPSTLSGGQRQRVAIARALALGPRVLICDEAVSALDVSVQAQVLNLLKRLSTESHLGCLFISHDIAVIRFIADEVAVMYLGAIVERGPAARVLDAPRHPYTIGLLSAVPRLGARERRRVPIEGEPPSPTRRPSGCGFHPRCPIARPRCAEVAPGLRSIEGEHAAACHFAEEAGVVLRAPAA